MSDFCIPIMSEDRRIVTNLPDRITLSEAELDILETYLSERIADMLAQPN